jgi:hypothetical protein
MLDLLEADTLSGLGLGRPFCSGGRFAVNQAIDARPESLNSIGELHYPFSVEVFKKVTSR